MSSVSFLEEQLNCPLDCPFLRMRTFMPNTLPFYCQKYDTFLGVDNNKMILRCSACLGIVRNVEQEGLSFIRSYLNASVNLEELQEVFLSLDPAFQKMFVDLLHQTGRQILVDSLTPITQNLFVEEILKTWQEAEKFSGSHELQELKAVLGDLKPAFPDLLTREVNKLLIHLFQVLDRSEQQMMMSALQNEKTAARFLEQFSRQPQDNDLLRNTRAVLYEIDSKEKQRQAELELNRRKEQQEQQLQQMRLLRERTGKYRVR